LGVRASDTGRSSSLSSFVKEGANYALIAVTVFNTGEDAYQPEIYGDFITVERRIGPQSGFVLKNASGRKVASGRNALTVMLDALNLNASNPVAVLTQDTARTFLAGAASDKRKYDLFMEVGTHRLLQFMNLSQICPIHLRTARNKSWTRHVVTSVTTEHKEIAIL
jgi:chromosome segregation ATPase